MITEITVGPRLDEIALSEYRELLEVAYQNGANNGGHIEINDIMLAVAKAAESFGPDAKQLIELADIGEVDDDVRIHFAEGTDVTSEAWSARMLIKSFRHNDGFDWEEIDAAFEALSNSISAPKM